MESPFSITVSSDNVRIENGQGETTITVTNTSGRALKARAEILPGKPEAAAWLSISKSPERAFVPGAVDQYVIKLNVPRGAAEGDHAFRLRVADVADPNERVTVGPAVGFKVAGTPPPPQPPPFPMWIFILIGVLVLAVVGGLVYWAVSGPDDAVVVPPEPKPEPKPEPPPEPPKPTLPPDACKPGYVWRQVIPSDHVCVTEETRTIVEADNAQAASRRNPNGGPYGPDTCLQGYVWRDALPGDHVCVPVPTRSQAAADNALAASRRIQQ